MGMREHFLLFAEYNLWANARLYEVAATLDDVEYRKDRRGFFSSIHGTLNHILVGDRIWLSRLTGAGAAPTRLDAILYDDLGALRGARAEEDERIRATIAGLTEPRIAESFEYVNSAGETFREPLAQILAHVFNHQTHHRGQAHDMLSQTGLEPPSLDLVQFIREAD